MLNTPFKTLLMGTKIAATASLLATTAMAQTTQIETPQGNSVIVPDVALEAQSPEGFVVEGEYPRLESIENYETIAETMIAQGYSDVFILREGPILTVTAQRGGQPTELVYSTANARLISVDGVMTQAEAEASSRNDPAQQATESEPEMGEEAPADDGMTDDTDDGTANDDGSTDDSTGGSGTDTDGTADGGAEGSDDSGADTGSEGSDTDGGASDSDTGSDAGGDSGSDGGADSGGESGADGGSDGGSDSGGEAGGGEGGDANG